MKQEIWSSATRSKTRPARIVGKGSLSGGGKTASYAYIVRCDPAANATAPFEVRFGTQRFRLTGTSSVSCTDDPAVTTPAAGFDTQTGSGTGTLTTGGPATIQWKFVDGGAGGATTVHRSRSGTPPTRSSSRAARPHPASSPAPPKPPATTQPSCCPSA